MNAKQLINGFNEVLLPKLIVVKAFVSYEFSYRAIVVLKYGVKLLQITDIYKFITTSRVIKMKIVTFTAIFIFKIVTVTAKSVTPTAIALLH